MDSIKVITLEDTTKTSQNVRTYHQKKVETTIAKNDDKRISICDCQLASDLVWPLTVLIIVFSFYKSFRNILRNVGKLKLGSFFEVELNKLSEKADEVEKTIIEQNLKATGISGHKHPYDFNYKITEDLPTEFLKISMEIEHTLRSIYQIAMKTREDRPLSVSMLLRGLREKQIIDVKFFQLLSDFWRFRNSVVHEINKVSEKHFVAFVDMGIRILKMLKVIQNNISDGTFNIEIYE